MNGVYFRGKYVEDKVYDLYVQRISCSFEIKKDKIPTIQIKNSMFYSSNLYLETTNGEEEELTLTSVDLKLFLEQYEVHNLIYIDGFKFKSINRIIYKIY